MTICKFHGYDVHNIKWHKYSVIIYILKMSFEIKSYFCIKIVGAYTALKCVTYTRERERETEF